jgi:hypothetical protein
MRRSGGRQPPKAFLKGPYGALEKELYRALFKGPCGALLTGPLGSFRRAPIERHILTEAAKTIRRPLTTQRCSRN